MEKDLIEALDVLELNPELNINSYYFHEYLVGNKVPKELLLRSIKAGLTSGIRNEILTKTDIEDIYGKMSNCCKYMVGRNPNTPKWILEEIKYFASDIFTTADLDTLVNNGIVTSEIAKHKNLSKKTIDTMLKNKLQVKDILQSQKLNESQFKYVDYLMYPYDVIAQEHCSIKILEELSDYQEYITIVAKHKKASLIIKRLKKYWYSRRALVQNPYITDIEWAKNDDHKLVRDAYLKEKQK